MKILIVGRGAREHALAWKAQQSLLVEKVYCAPGNAGTGEFCTNLNANTIDQLVDQATALGIDYTIVGPENYLVDGIVERFRQLGLKIFGPTAEAAKLEGSKSFTKEILIENNIPTARAEVFDSSRRANNFALRNDMNSWVIKADGLASGKGVLLPKTCAEAVSFVLKNMAGENQKILFEERLQGREVSVMAFTDGYNLSLLPPAQDHKRVFDNNGGPNTGGMGSFSTPELIEKNLISHISEEILKPTLIGLRKRGITYTGLLYAGLMITSEGPKVLEFNCRLGDPETQAVLPLLKSDLIEVMIASDSGRLLGKQVLWEEKSCCSVVMASKGYPGDYETGKRIYGLEKVPPEILVFHAGTKLHGKNTITDGGRVLSVTAVANSLEEAIAKSYRGVHKIHFEGAHFRRDIGK